MPLIQCVYCDNVYDPVRTRGACNACGREHPPGTRQIVVPNPPGMVVSAGPLRRVDAHELRVRQQASAALFAVAVLQLVCGGTIVAYFGMLFQGVQGANDQLFVMVLVLLAVSGTFILLGLWARYQPLAPALLGLVLYTGLCGLQMLSVFLGRVGVDLCCGVVLMNLAVYVGLIQAVLAALGSGQATRRDE